MFRFRGTYLFQKHPPTFGVAGGKRQTKNAHWRRRPIYTQKSGNARPAVLMILPVGEYTAETIIVTFVYIEKLR
jgi:hypothetical protein